jgi:hypothetical protein
VDYAFRAVARRVWTPLDHPIPCSLRRRARPFIMDTADEKEDAAGYSFSRFSGPADSACIWGRTVALVAIDESSGIVRLEVAANCRTLLAASFCSCLMLGDDSRLRPDQWIVSCRADYLETES